MAGHSEELLATWKDTTANPAPLGLLGFGLTTMLLNIHNTGYYGLAGAILSMGLFVGGLAQVIAGIMEWRKGNTFGTVAFTAYGFFWISLVGIFLGNLYPKVGLGTTSHGFLGWYLFLWGLFSLFMFVGTLKGVRVLSLVFGTLVILFFLLATGHWVMGTAELDALGKVTALGEGTMKTGENIIKVAGWVGIVCGFLAFYTAMAEVLNEVYGRVVMPLGAGKKKSSPSSS